MHSGRSGIINDWQDRVGLHVHQLEYEAKALGFRAHLHLEIHYSNVAGSTPTVRFEGRVNAFAPLKSEAIVEYQIQSRWQKEASGWRLLSWDDHDSFRKITRTFVLSSDGSTVLSVREKPGEEKKEERLSMKDARAKVQILAEAKVLDPLTAIAFGMTAPRLTASDSDQIPFVYMLQKSGIKKIPTHIAEENLEIRFDKTEIVFQDWSGDSYATILVKDPRLPISARLTRVIPP